MSVRDGCKMTELGLIPDEWEVKDLSKVCEFSQGIQVSLEAQYDTNDEERIRFLRIVDYTQNSEDYRYIDNPGERYIVKENE